MVKLTVIYTLPEGADHEEFLRWRTTEHQEDNMGTPGVLKSDFYTVKRIFSHTPGDANREAKLNEEPLTMRYMTEAYWPDMKSFEKAFFDEKYQEELMEALKWVADPQFFISEEVMSAEN